MEIKRIISPFIVIGLFLTFAVIVAIVYLQRGKKEKWISRKMKLGAAILTFTGITTGCPPQVMCYDPVPQNWFGFDQENYDENAIVADLPDDSVLTGKVFDPIFEKYIFEIFTNDSFIVQQGDVISDDGHFDETEENFKITLKTDIDTGSYQLNIISDDPDNTQNYIVSQNYLKIK